MGSPISEETFLARARARFGERYDYTEIVYKSYKTPIRIRCREHPVRIISITPEKHLCTTGGCKYCLRALRHQRQNPRSGSPPPDAGPDSLRDPFSRILSLQGARTQRRPVLS
jgi:hypothetical protein